jgi:Protein of unknown function (DUF3644)/EC042_2821-lke REase
LAQLTRSVRFLQKAEAALLSSIEAYNRPTFAYREETFAILALNAWELLLKAKLLAESSNKPRCLHVFERRSLRNGQQSKKLYLKRNRSGAALTHSLWKTISELENRTTIKVDASIKSNLEALTEIRDNAVHFVIASRQLAKQVLEIGTAAVRNFVELARLWFQHDLSGRHFFLMPIGFVDPPESSAAVLLSKDESRLISYLAQLAGHQTPGGKSPFNVTLEVNLSFKRTMAAGALAVAITNDPAAPQINLTEDDFKKIYKWTYQQLLEQLKKRYTDFKVNSKFVAIRKPLMGDVKFVRPRYLDPDNPKSGKKDFYSPAIIGEFDKHYTRKAAASAA